MDRQQALQNAADLHAKGLEFLQQGERERARRVFQELCQLCRDTSKFEYGMGPGFSGIAIMRATAEQVETLDLLADAELLMERVLEAIQVMAPEARRDIEYCRARLGTSCGKRGKLQESEAHLRTAVKNLGVCVSADDDLLLQANHDLAWTLSRLGNHSDAKALQLELIDSCRATGRDPSKFELNLAIALKRLGDWDGAFEIETRLCGRLQHHVNQERACGTDPDTLRELLTMQAQALTCRAKSLDHQRNPEEERRHLEQALSIKQELGIPKASPDMRVTLENLAKQDIADGVHLERAIGTYEESLRLCPQSEFNPEIVGFRSQIACAKIQLGDYEEARQVLDDTYREMCRSYPEDAFRDFKHILNNRVACLLRSPDPVRAAHIARDHQAFLHRTRETCDPHIRSKALQSLATSLWVAGDLGPARRALLEACEQRRELLDGALQIERSNVAFDPDLIHQIVTIRDPATSPQQNAREELNAIGLMRGSGALSRWYRRAIAELAKVDEGVALARGCAEVTANRYREQVARGGDVTGIQAEERQARAKLVALTMAHGVRPPSRLWPADAVDRVAKALRHDQVLLLSCHYARLDLARGRETQELAIYRVTHESVECFDLGDAERVLALVNCIQMALQGNRRWDVDIDAILGLASREPSLRDPILKCLTNDTELAKSIRGLSDAKDTGRWNTMDLMLRKEGWYVSSTAEMLSQKEVEPVEKMELLRLASKRLRTILDPVFASLNGTTELLVCPDGPLAALPWEVFAHGDGRRRETYRIRYISSPVTLLEAKSHTTGEPSLLCMGNMDYGSAEVSGGPYKALTESAREMAAIRTRFLVRDGDRKRTALVERNAATADVFREACGDKRFIHLATHADYAPHGQKPRETLPTWLRLDMGRDVVDTMRAWIVFAGANDPDREESDRFIPALELAALDLQTCELFALSACSGNVGLRDRGDATAGLNRALHEAGVRYTITALWHVRDVTTSKFMHKFYQLLWGKGLSIPEAFEGAQGHLQKHLDGGDPESWPAFVLYGI